MKSAKTLLPLALLLMAAACSGGADDGNNTADDSPARTEAEDDAAVPTDAANGTSDAPAADAAILTLEGLGALKIGEAPPSNSGWAMRGAQVSDGCSTLSSPDFPGAYAIVEDGTVRRITLGKRSDVQLVEGIGIGSSEAEVRGAFPGFREEPHKYVEEPAKYLTAPMDGTGPGLRFEIDRDGRVSAVHVGLMPQLAYVEGCA